MSASLSAAKCKSSDGFFNDTNQTSPQVPYSSLSSLPFSDICLVSVGLTLNLLIAYRIVTQQRLHKPRHIFWLGVTFSCLFAQLVSLNELFFFYVYPDDGSACVTFHLLWGVPYANLLLNVFFCLVDHYVAITYPMWHTREIKIKWIFTAQLSGLFFISILFKISYALDGNFSLISCRRDDKLHGKIVLFTLVTLAVLCLVTQVAIYLEIKRKLLVKSSNLPQLQTVEIVEEISMSSSQIIDRRCSNIVVHVDTEATGNLLEKEAAWTLIFRVILLLLFSSPIFIAPLHILFCSQVSDNCAPTAWIISHFREIILVHSIYVPVVYVSRNRELFTN